MRRREYYKLKKYMIGNKKEIARLRDNLKRIFILIVKNI